MVFHDYECSTCGHLHKDVFTRRREDIKKRIDCEKCGRNAPMVFNTVNRIHHDHSSMYGKFHPGFGEVVNSYSHKQELLRKYNVTESSDPVGGSREHRPGDLFDKKPKLDGLQPGFGDTPKAAIAAAERLRTED